VPGADSGSGTGPQGSARDTQRVAFLHTVTGLATSFQALAAELLPAVEVFSVVDESLLRRTIREGRLQTRTVRRLAGLVASVEDEDVDAILVTCSSLGPAVEAARPLCAVPLLRVDEPMAREAVTLGGRIGVLATLPTTLEPTVDLVERTAERAGRDVTVAAELCDGAFDAVSAGDVERHDALVRESLARLAGRVDVVVLAQASMARVVDGLPEVPAVPVLSSPRSAVEEVAAVLG
jgi:Asp/Glu/hydantoin racemase